MDKKIRIGIVGYGNLGRGVEMALKQNPDFELEAIFTKRDPKTLQTSHKAIHVSEIWNYKEKIDVMILCGGSANDTPIQGPLIASCFNTVDSFDNHKQIPEYFKKVNEAATNSGKLSLISVGWDPGLFSINRLLAQSVLPNGKDYTFWGKGVSQGHSDAIRSIKGVKDAIQYTIPIESAIEKVNTFENPDLKACEKHKRDCYVVVEEGEDLDRIENEIKKMPNYFEGYDTTIHFISEEELAIHRSKIPHGGFVICTGKTGDGNRKKIKFSLDLESNPEFTSSVMIAYARAIHKLSIEGKSGACTVFDIPLGYLSPKSMEELRKELL